MLDKINDRHFTASFICLFFAACGLLFACVGFSEFYNIVIKNEGGAYAFGGGYQWYYESESIYWKYNLIEGSIYLLASIFTIVSVIKKKERMSAGGAIAIFILFVIMMINANSAPYE